MEANDYSLVYVMDAYCGWCYGFSNSISTFNNIHPEIEIDVISGGLFTGEASLPIKNYPHMPTANQRISQLTGAVFGPAYLELLKDGSFILNSEDAARGLAALKAVDSSRGVEYAAAMQHAFFYDGQSLSDDKTYLTIANMLNLDANLVANELKSPTALTSAYHDFMMASKLAVEGFPTLLLKQGDKYTYLGGSALKPAEIEAKIATLI